MPQVCFRQGKLLKTRNGFLGEASQTKRKPDRGARFEATIATIIIRKIDDLKIVTELSPGQGFWVSTDDSMGARSRSSDLCRTKRRKKLSAPHLSKIARIAGLVLFYFTHSPNRCRYSIELMNALTISASR